MAEDSGNCLAYIRNWRYDSSTGKCVQFTYGGCGGNANNFQSSQVCEAFCTRSGMKKKYLYLFQNFIMLIITNVFFGLNIGSFSMLPFRFALVQLSVLTNILGLVEPNNRIQGQ